MNILKKKFKQEIFETFKKKKEPFSAINYIEPKDKFPKIKNDLIKIQNYSINQISEFNFNFGDFVKECLEAPMEKENLEYIKTQIEDTLKLLNYSYLKEASLYSLYQIRIIEKFYDEFLDKINLIKIENKNQKINSDELLQIESLKPILLRFRLLGALTNKGKSNFFYCLNPILYNQNIKQLLEKLDDLILKKINVHYKN